MARLRETYHWCSNLWSCLGKVLSLRILPLTATCVAVWSRSLRSYAVGWDWAMGVFTDCYSLYVIAGAEPWGWQHAVMRDVTHGFWSEVPSMWQGRKGLWIVIVLDVCALPVIWHSLSPKMKLAMPFFQGPRIGVPGLVFHLHPGFCTPVYKKRVQLANFKRRVILAQWKKKCQYLKTKL